MTNDGYQRLGADGFGVPEAGREIARRLRGRLPAAVTVWTTGRPGGDPQGLTVSSVMLAEGDPSSVVGLIGPLTDFWEVARATGRFVVNVLASDQVRLADQFAGRYPGPLFENVDVEPTEHGPRLAAASTWAACRLEEGPSEIGYFLLVRGVIEAAQVGPESPPLLHYRGRYLTTESRRDERRNRGPTG